MMESSTKPGKTTVGVQPENTQLSKLLRSRNVMLLLLILAISAILTVLEPQFLTSSNLTSVMMGLTYDLLMACGMTLVLILAGIDLSVGSVLGLTAVVTTLLMTEYALPIPIAIGLGLLLAAGCGAINGLFIARFKIAPFIVTLAMMSIARGVATVLTSGYFVTGLPEAYLSIGQGELLGIPYPIIIAIPIVLIFDGLLRNWKPLNQSFFIGNNEDAALFSGIRVGTVVFSAYVINALLAGLAAIFMTSRLAMGFFQFGLGAELTAIAAAVIGGASMTGGSGSIIGTMLGVLLLAIINNGFVLLNGSPNWQSVMSGAILVVALIVDAYRRRNESRE